MSSHLCNRLHKFYKFLFWCNPENTGNHFLRSAIRRMIQIMKKEDFV
jgi:histidinol-phosphate/aromatic aminotransferase/cobyric acid decarboxylase-like protein